MSGQESSQPSPEAVAAADYLLTHVGGDESDPWQAGHNYAMREAARLIREQQHLLDYGARRECPDCGAPSPHTVHANGTRVECGGWPVDEGVPDSERATCGASWAVDQRGIFTPDGVSQ